MCRTWVVAALVIVVSVAIRVSGVAGRDSDYYLDRWNDKNRGKSKAITPEDPTAQIPSPLLSPWSRLPPGATGKLILTSAATSNATTQIPDDAQLLPPSLVDPPATSPAFRNSSERDPKLLKLSVSPMLSLFNIRRVANTPCLSSSGENGTCFNARECKRLGGVTSGSCKTGGNCCVFQVSCGGLVTQNCTYFVNENYPKPFDGVGSCQLTVNKVNPSVCQLRLDFDSLVLSGPETTDNRCLNDRFTVSGGSSTPIICGTSTGNHMYVDLGRTSNTQAVLTVITMGPAFERSWKVKVSQIPCNTDYTAPNGCLQYYQGVTGQIKTYNYDVSTGLQLSNQDYTSCVRTERNFCGIQYTACADTVNVDPESFSLTGSTTTQVGAVVGQANCPNDWLIIPCLSDSSVDPTANCVDRICGDAFNVREGVTVGDAVLYSFVKPFTLVYHTDDTEGNAAVLESGNRGYCLNYVQQPCV
ncbi:hypothetical protein O3P69_001524 [Scylla paramamosain]|uniref:CUB domain-containing protein n=1 Tax=Scylla paramamosain TaxID=85552 RepID=A0AAW0V295_SCYPA